MNILASYPWIKEYLKTSATPEEFARELSLRGPGVEKILSTEDAFRNIIVGKVLSVAVHPNADRLRVANVDLGDGAAYQIVCGGTNLAEGQLVPVALPGARVRWHGEGEPVTLAPTEIRGVKSDGMICAPNEIGLDGLFSCGEREILDLSATNAKVGMSVGAAVGFEDPIFDIEVTTNRPDAYSMLGLAREAAACGLGTFQDHAPSLPKLRAKPQLHVSIEAKHLCPRYMAAVVSGIRVTSSPTWMQARLLQAGLRPINNIVDLTNYVMLELGHPLHAFDRALLDADTIRVRTAAEGERFRALDGKEHELSTRDLVIADGTKPVALAGVIGGADSGVTERTLQVVFEAAAFDPVAIRKTSRGYVLMTDAALRFEKGLSSEACPVALARVLSLLPEVCPEAQVQELVDVVEEKRKPHHYAFRPEAATQLIGEAIPEQTMKKSLEALGFEVSAKGNRWDVAVPYWRDFDIEGERDLIEEIARIHGYHRLTPELPSGTPSVRAQDPVLAWESELKLFFEHIGCTETFTYSLIDPELYRNIGLSTDELLPVWNPLASDLAKMRTTLVPSLLSVVAENQHRFPSGRLFEIAKVYLPKPNALPTETSRIIFVSYGHEGESAFFAAKGMWEGLAKKYGIRSFALERPTDADVLWHPGRTARVTVDGEALGIVGEIHPEVQKRLGIDARVGVLELNLDALVSHLSFSKRCDPIPAFPSVKRDVSFVLPLRTAHADIVAALRGLDERIVDVEKFDEFRGKGVGAEEKSVAYHLELRSDAGTLSSADADEMMKRVKEMLQKRFSALVRD